MIGTSNYYRAFPESNVWTYEQLNEWRWQCYEASNYENFSLWLAQFSEDQVVGHAFRPDDDPLANCINAKYPWLAASVGRAKVFCSITRTLIPGTSSNFSNGINDLFYMGGIGGSLQLHRYIAYYVDALDRLFYGSEQYEKTVNSAGGIMPPLCRQLWPVTAKQVRSVLAEAFEQSLAQAAVSRV
ncbi:MAG TPA: hypothetical protein V6D07_18520 [Trichocoleus sp.]